MAKGKDQNSAIAWAWQIADWLLILGFSALLYLAFLNRSAYLNSKFGVHIGCVDCLTYPALLHDLLYFSVLVALLIVSFGVRRFYLYVPLRLLAVLGLLVYIADVATMEQFFTRLTVSDVRIYGDQWSLLWRHVQNTEFLAGYGWLLPAVTAGLLVLLLLPPARTAHRLSLGIWLLLPAVGVLGSALAEPPSYVHDWAVRNVMAANFNTGVAKPYGERYAQELLELARSEPLQCRAGNNRSPDIVLLVLESWSPYQSRLMMGLNDWTPRLDRLAEENTWFSRFHAGGYSTNGGLMSLLAGLEYVAPVKSFFQVTPFETGWETDWSIPQVLSESQGYHAAFLTSGNLKFSNKRGWAYSLGFDYVEGHDHPSYQGHPRRHFDAVPDEVLYHRSLDYIREAVARADKPLFLTIETVSTHHPYMHPVTGERSEEMAFRYMDETAYNFYQALEKDGFFDNGVLIIVSDHRAMIPIRVEEVQAMGQMAASRIPAIIVGDSNPRGEVFEPFHQSDLLPSLVALTEDKYCRVGGYRNLFDPEGSEPRCLLHARGDNRDHLDVFCPEGSGVVGLMGDNTRLNRSKGIDSELALRIVTEANKHRIVGDARTQRLIAAGYFD